MSKPKKQVYEEVLAKIRPSPEERAKFVAVTASFLKRLNQIISPLKAILGGSGAKDTWLAGSHDIDIFVLFPLQKYKAQSDKLSSILEPLLRRAFPHQTLHSLHGSRDYFQLIYEDFVFEVVPILYIQKAEQAVNITDVSPLHSKWVNKQALKLIDEIRLAKQFCKAQRIYGAESYIQGFSGYVLEILVTSYGSFLQLLKASQRWKEKEVIDAAKHYPKSDALFHLNKSKQHSPLVVIDPVDKTRNASAALSINSLKIFQKKAKELLQNISPDYFTIQPINEKALQGEAKKKKQHLLLITVKPLSGKEDVVGAKLLKIFTYLSEKLEPYVISKADWDWPGNEALFYFLLKKKELPLWEIHRGPPLELNEAVINFKKKYKDAYIENKKLMVKVKVSHPHLLDFAKNLLKEEYIISRIKQIQRIDLLE